MDKLEMAKKVIEAHIDEASLGLFNSRNTVGDAMETICVTDGLQIDICRYLEYFEVFGLSSDEFRELLSFYYDIRKR